MPHVLLIEDDARIREIVERGLGSRGFVVTSAEDGLAGVDLARKAGPLTVDPVAHRAVLNGREVPLSARELALLAAFVRHTGQVLSRSQLLDMVWDLNFDPGSNVVEVYVAALRRKLGPEW